MNQYITLVLGISMSLVGADVLIRRESGLLNPGMARTRFGQVMVLILGSIWLLTGIALLIAPFVPDMDQAEIAGFAAIIATVEFTMVFVAWLVVWVAQKIAPLLPRRRATTSNASACISAPQQVCIRIRTRSGHCQPSLRGSGGCISTFRSRDSRGASGKHPPGL
jgi:hypothetical protein